LIAITEHVRKDPDFDMNRLLDDIDIARNEYPGITVLSGVEAKVLSDGSLDVDENILKAVDHPIFAFHRFPPDIGLYIECLERAIKNQYVNAWAHPGWFLQKNNLAIDMAILDEVFGMMSRHDVLLELNGKYGLPQKSWINKAAEMGVGLVRGDDIHALQDFGRWKTKWW
jgi:putative hydrolase